MRLRAGTAVSRTARWIRRVSHDHRVGQLHAEQQSTHPDVGSDGAHDVGHARAGLLLRRRRRDRRLCGGGVGSHPEPAPHIPGRGRGSGRACAGRSGRNNRGGVGGVDCQAAPAKIRHGCHIGGAQKPEQRTMGVDAEHFPTDAVGPRQEGWAQADRRTAAQTLRFPADPVADGDVHAFILVIPLLVGNVGDQFLVDTTPCIVRGLDREAVRVAQFVGPEGAVDVLDVQPSMLDATRQRAQRHRLHNVVTLTPTLPVLPPPPRSQAGSRHQRKIGVDRDAHPPIVFSRTLLEDDISTRFPTPWRTRSALRRSQGTESPDMPGRFSSACFDGNYPIELRRRTALGEHVIQRWPMSPEPAPIQLALCNRRTSTCLHCAVPSVVGRR